MNKKFILYQILVFASIIFGILLRVLFLSYGRDFCWDECALAMNIIEGSNLFKPLKYFQVSPQLFMCLSKMFYIIIPNTTLAFKIIPCLASIASIFVFYKLSEKVLNKSFSKVSALLMFCICYHLCRYAEEFKQYSSDVLSFLLILLSYFYLEKIVQKKSYLLVYSIILSLLIWSSYCTPIALFILLVTVCIFKANLLNKLCIPISFVVINLPVYIYINSWLFTDGFLNDYWSNAFLTKNLSNLISLNLYNVNYIFGGWVIELVIISLCFVYLCFKDFKSEKTFIIVFPILLMHILSYCHLFPYSKRLILFLVPLFFLFIARFLDFINIYIGIIVCALILHPMTKQSVENIIYKKYIDASIDEVLEYAIKNASSEDIIFIPTYNEILYFYYAVSKAVPSKKQIVVQRKFFDNLDDIIKDFVNFKKGQTYYYVISCNFIGYEKLKEELINLLKDKRDYELYVTQKNSMCIKFTND